LGAGRLAPRRARVVHLRDAEGATLDRGVALWFRAPHSYTGEDVVELQVHGSPPVLALILARCLALGARLARPGEFPSARSSKAASTWRRPKPWPTSWRPAPRRRRAQRCARSKGEFSDRVGSVQRDLTRLRVQVEAGLDFPDEELELDGRGPRSRARLAALRAALAELRAAAGPRPAPARRPARRHRGRAQRRASRAS
jgi:tRNA modification GTPase